MSKLYHTVDEIAAALIHRGVATEQALVGCSPAEISQLQNEVGYPLPQAYRDFLLRMGREMGRFFDGSDITYENLPGLKQAAQKLVKEEQTALVLHDDAIPILMHQGYQFMFIRASEGEDPPVYHYMEMSGEFVTISQHLTQYLFDSAHDEW